jgi:glycosyltransferase involved in cell wall biosynthesis
MPDLHDIAVVSTVVPPGATGQARVLEHLLQDRDPERCFLFSDQSSDSGNLAVKRYGIYVPLSPPQFLLLPKLTDKRVFDINNMLGLNRTILRRSAEIAAQLRRKRPVAIVGCSGNPFDLPASFLAARRVGIPFLSYLFDDPVYQWPPGVYRRLAHFWERIWMPRSAVVIAPNETLVEDIVLRSPKIEPAIVRNPVSAEAFVKVSEPATRAHSGPRHIVYTGTVYHAQADALRNVVKVLESLNGRYQLHVYTSQPQSALDAHGVVGPHVHRHDHLELSDVYRIQREADVLLLPLAFQSTIQEVIRSSAPGKMAEYLASGRPVLVHAPAGSFVCNFFTRRKCGMVVDRLDPELLRERLLALEDCGTRATFGGNARDAAEEFHVERARASFWMLVDRSMRRGTG